MARYLVLGKYTPQGASGAQRDGFEVREREGAKAMAAAGATVESWMWLDWTTWDFGFIVRADDPKALIRVASYSATTGAFERISWSEILDSAEMTSTGGALDYRPPGQASS